MPRMPSTTLQPLPYEPEAGWPEPGTYRHFKGGTYTLVAVGRSSETEELQAIYAAADGRLWVRPLAMFTERVPNPAGEGTVDRFALVEPV